LRVSRGELSSALGGLDAAAVLRGRVLEAMPTVAEFERRLDAGGATVALDTDRFRRVITNLLENAFQSLIDAGDRPRRVAITTAAADGVEIAIEDSGAGIAPDVLPRIFEPLFSTKSFGTGLGLPTVKQIVEQHQGTIAVASTVGAGTTVRIRLPAAALRSEQASAA